MEEVNEYEIEGLKEILKESGINGIMKYTDVLILNHMIERGWIPSDRDGIIKTLKEHTDKSYGEITNLLQRYDEWKRYLPSYSLNLNQKLDSINKRLNSVVPFKWIGDGNNKKLIGFVGEGNVISVYDGSGKNLIRICEISKMDWGIRWNDSTKLSIPQQRYILEEMKHLKLMNWFSYGESI